MSPTSEDGFSCNFVPLDVVLLLDTSGSIPNGALAKLLNFSAHLVNNLPYAVGPHPVLGSRVAVIHFDTVATILANFSTYTTASGIGAAIRAAARLPLGLTNTHLALNQLRTQVLLSSGITGWRNLSVPTVVVLITDGTATDARRFDTAVANLDAKFGYSLTRLAFGVDQYNATQLLNFAQGFHHHVNTRQAFLGIDSPAHIAEFGRRLFCEPLTTVSPTTASPTSASPNTFSPSSISPTTVSPTTVASVCYDGPVDLAFVFDTSGTLTPASLTRMFDYAAGLVGLLPAVVGPNAAQHSRVAAISFDTLAKVDFNFTRHTTAAAAQAALRNITRVTTTGATAAHLAVNMLRTALLAVKTPPTGWRNGAVPTFVVFVTDGPATDAKRFETAVAAFDSKYHTTVTRFAVGVDAYNMTQLLLQAQGVERHVTTFANFASLPTGAALTAHVHRMFCERPTTTASPTTASPTTVSPTTVSPTSVSPTTVSPTTVSPTTAVPVCYSGPVDLTFVLDTSGTVTANGLSRMYNFSANVVGQLPAAVSGDAATGSRVAAINFDNTAKVNFLFKQHLNPAAVQTALKAIVRATSTGGTSTHLAINMLRTDVLAVKNPSTGWRNRAVPSYVVFVTDGPATDAKRFETAVKNFDTAFGSTVTRFAVGVGAVGTYNTTQLLMMANNDATNVFTVTTFTGLVADGYARWFARRMFCNSV